MVDNNAPSGRRRPGRIRAAAAAAALLLFPALLAACGNDGDYAGAGGMSVSIVEPAKDATVSVPFTVKVDASVPLGATETGQHHVHLWFDDNKDDYLVVESETTEVTDLPQGEHTLHISLRNANHSSAGAEAEIRVRVGTGSAPAPTTTAPAKTESPTDDPYQY